MSEDNVKQTFATKLKELREEKGLSQTQLAEKLGVSRGSVSFYENTERMAGIDFLAKAAAFFECSTDYLLGLSNIRNHNYDEDLIRMLKKDDLVKALKKYDNAMIRGKRSALSFLIDVLNANAWFYFTLSSIYDYVEYEEADHEEFITMHIENGLIDEVTPDRALDDFFQSAQNQLGNVCRRLREKRIKKDGE